MLPTINLSSTGKTQLVQSHDFPPVNLFVLPRPIFESFTVAKATVPVLEGEVRLEREAKEVYLRDNIRLEALNKKLVSQQIIDKDIMNTQALDIVDLEIKSKNNLYIGLAIGASSASILFILLN